MPGSERDKSFETAVGFTAMVAPRHSWVLEQGFLVWNLLYNDFFVDRPFSKLGRREKVVTCLPNTSMFVLNYKCLRCALPIIWCAFGAHQNIGLAERTTP